MDANPIGGLKKTEKYPGDKIPSRPTDEEFYRVNFPCLGLMIILNHYIFKPRGNKTLSPRKGTDVDLENLIKTFENIGYEVRNYTDQTTEQIKGILKGVSQEDHSKNMSIIVVMLTHGDEDGDLYTYDAKIKVEDLWRPFTADKCKSLAGQPKMFFLQACKGTMHDPGAFLEEDSENKGLLSLSSKASSSSYQPPHVIPTLADILIFYSTAEGYPSFRNHTYGTCFIRALCEKFREYLQCKKEVELMRILTAVTREVAFGFQAHFNDGQNERYHSSKQMPTVMTMLTKILIFNRELEIT